MFLFSPSSQHKYYLLLLVLNSSGIHNNNHHHSRYFVGMELLFGKIGNNEEDASIVLLVSINAPFNCRVGFQVVIVIPAHTTP